MSLLRLLIHRILTWRRLPALLCIAAYVIGLGVFLDAVTSGDTPGFGATGAAWPSAAEPAQVVPSPGAGPAGEPGAGGITDQARHLLDPGNVGRAERVKR